MQISSATHDDEMMSKLERLGVNLRVHGRLALADLPATIRVPIKRWLKEVSSGGKYDAVGSLFFQGEVGTGKTQAAVCIVRELIAEGWPPASIIFDNSRDIITEVQDRYSTGRVREYSLARERCGLWILDDVGTEKGTADALRIIEAIIDKREGYPSVITSNLKRSEWAKRWAGMEGWQRLASRMQRFNPVGFEGVDHRRGG